jgi:hypothetical protein
MPKNDLIDDIDYSSLHPAEPAPAETKPSVQNRQFKKDTPKAQAKDIDIGALKAEAAQAKVASGKAEVPASPLDYVIPGLGILGGLYLLNQTLQPRALPTSPKPDMRIGIPPSIPNPTPLPNGLSPAEFDALTPEDKALVVRGGQNTIAKQVAQQELAQQVNKLQTDLASIPQTAHAVPVTKEVEQAFEAQKSQPLMTGTGRSVVEGQGTSNRFYKNYQSPTDVPKGYAWVPNSQYADVLRNDIGQEAYTKTYTGKEFPSSYTEAQSHVQEVNRGLNRPTHAEMKAQGIIPPEPEKGIFRKIGENKKVMVGGKIGALVSIADLAKAATPEEKLAAGEAFLPIGMTPTEASAPGIAQRTIQNSALLGSPYAQTEWAKTQRLKEKAGAGRGIAPPSAYMR